MTSHLSQLEREREKCAEIIYALLEIVERAYDIPKEQQSDPYEIIFHDATGRLLNTFGPSISPELIKFLGELDPRKKEEFLEKHIRTAERLRILGMLKGTRI